MKTMINLKGFSIDEYNVTKSDWDAIRLWAADKGYNDLSVGRGTERQPVGCINWYDAVKFFNAMSELAGLKPVYRTPDGCIYRNGEIDITENNIDKNADGYRLPKVSEWVYAAKGGTDTPYFWGDEESGGAAYAWSCNTGEITHDVGEKKPNPYGLYDIIGNVYEWCFECKDSTFRAMMGGSVMLDAVLETDKVLYVPPKYECYETGVRAVSGSNCALSARELAKRSKYFGRHEKPYPRYPDMNTDAVAKRLCTQLGNDKLSFRIKTMVADGNTKKALEIYRDIKLNYIYERYNITEDVPSLQKSDEELLNISDIFEFDFFAGNFEYDISPNVIELDYMAYRYSVTKDMRYIKTYMLILRAYLIRQKAEFDVLSDDELKRKDDTPMTWMWGNGFNPGKRSLNIMTALARFANAVGKQNFHLFPSELFAQLAVSFITYGIYPTLKDGREKISNQIAHCASWCLTITGLFPEFENSEVFGSFVINRWGDELKRVLYPDGSSCEQALNYNYGLIHAYFEVKDKCGNEEMLEKIRSIIENTSRMITAVTPPIAAMPMTAYTTNQFAPAIYKGDYKHYFEYLDRVYERELTWSEYDRIKGLILNPNGACPKFNSVFFPYGGTAVIRDGWRRKDRYMYFFAPRAGAGHSAECVGDIQLYAHGRNLIRSGCRQSYRLLMHLSKDQIGMMNEADKYARSSYSRNTVLVDDSGQSRMKETEQVHTKKYACSTGYKWYESDRIVYAESLYCDGYYSADDVTHKREIVFMKENGLWIIVDRLNSKRIHAYSQLWHLPLKGTFVEFKNNPEQEGWEIDGFDRDDIVTGENIVFTKEMSVPNIFIRHIGNVRYNRISGRKEPVRGWSAYETPGYFRYYPVEEIYCNFNESVLITVIETSPTEKSAVENFIQNNKSGSFSLGKDRYEIISENERVEIKKNKTTWIVLDGDGREYSETVNGKKSEFTAPNGMRWIERDGYYYPQYY